MKAKFFRGGSMSEYRPGANVIKLFYGCKLQMFIIS